MRITKRWLAIVGIAAFSAGMILGGNSVNDDYYSQDVQLSASEIRRSTGGDLIPVELFSELGARQAMQAQYLIWLDEVRLSKLAQQSIRKQSINKEFLNDLRKSNVIIKHKGSALNSISGQQFHTLVPEKQYEATTLEISNRYGGWCSISYNDEYKCLVPYKLSEQ